MTYAQPNGWGADKGAVIVQHTFRDGRRILSFYGHLDPPSVELRTGQCTERGDLVGAIGDPRSPPHLHFEIWQQGEAVDPRTVVAGDPPQN